MRLPKDDLDHDLDQDLEPKQAITIDIVGTDAGNHSLRFPVDDGYTRIGHGTLGSYRSIGATLPQSSDAADFMYQWTGGESTSTLSGGTDDEMNEMTSWNFMRNPASLWRNPTAVSRGTIANEPVGDE